MYILQFLFAASLKLQFKIKDKFGVENQSGMIIHQLAKCCLQTAYI